MPKLIRSARLSSSAPSAEERSLRATRPSNRSHIEPISSSVTAVAALCLSGAASGLVMCGTSTPVVIE